MRKTIFLLMFIFSLTSCDELLTEKFVVDNFHDNSVSVSLENMNGNVIDTIIPSNTKDFELYINTGYGNSVDEIQLDRLFKYFIVKSDTITSNLNYLDNSVWEYKEFSETSSEYRLTINSSHFSKN